MSSPNQNLRDALLAQQSCDQNRLADHQREIEAMLSENERRLRREKWGVTALWFFVVALTTTFLIVGGYRYDTNLGLWLGIAGIFWFLFGAVELIKHFINRSRVEILKEVKQVELALIELRESLARK